MPYPILPNDSNFLITKQAIIPDDVRIRDFQNQITVNIKLV